MGRGENKVEKQTKKNKHIMERISLEMVFYMEMTCTTQTKDTVMEMSVSSSSVHQVILIWSTAPVCRGWTEKLACSVFCRTIADCLQVNAFIVMFITLQYIISLFFTVRVASGGWAGTKRNIKVCCWWRHKEIRAPQEDRVSSGPPTSSLEMQENAHN